MNETIKWLKEPQNTKKVLMGLLALNLIAGSTLLFITANGQGPLYEVIKPSVVEERHILQKQYIGDIIDNGVEYKDVLIFEVIDLDDNNISSNKSHKLYFGREHVKRFDLNSGDVIICTWLIQATGERNIISVVNPNVYDKVDIELYTLN